MNKKNLAFYWAKTVLMWITGMILYSTAVNGFALPNSIAQSGMTGAAVIFHNLFGWPVGTVGFILNLPLLIMMFFFIGKESLAKTLAVSAILSVCLDVGAWLFRTHIPVYTGDKILASVVCGILQGAGLGLVMVTGATSGGTDIIGRLVHKKWPHITVGKVVLAADGLIVIANMIVMRKLESGLYAIIVAFISTKVIDAMIYGMGNGKLLLIVTDKADEVSKAIVSSSPRGVSIIPAVGAYTGEEKNVLMCVARKNEISGIIKTVQKTDSKTFTIVTEANEILGKGFSASL